MPDNKKVGMGSNKDKQTSKTAGRDVGQQGKNATSNNQSQKNAGSFNRADKGNASVDTSKKAQKNLDTDDDIG